MAALHPRNLHGGRYDFPVLCEAVPTLAEYLVKNPAGDQTIDFSNASAVLCLNQALLAHYYGVRNWMIPAGYLCPPIPGRADYIHYLADLLATGGEIPKGKGMKVLDIGTGANCVYPIIGSQSYGWKFVGSEIDPISIKTARTIVEVNPCLTKQIKIVAQTDANSIFKGIIAPGDYFDLTMCNPPFHESMEEAQAANQRKVKSLNQRKQGLNFGGQNAELWCPGGELAFLKKMAKESVEFSAQVGWFTSLISKAETLPPLERYLKKLKAQNVTVQKMSQGQKVSRFIAWRF